MSSLIPIFLAHVIQFIRETESTDSSQRTNTKEVSGNEHLIIELRETCAELAQIVTFTNPLYIEPCFESHPMPINWSLARQITAKLGQVFVALVDTFVRKEIEVLIEIN